jgi:hypothetical protein
MAGAKNGVFAEKISPYLRKKIEEAGEPLPFLDLQYTVDPSEAVEQPFEVARHYQSEMSTLFEGRVVHGVEKLYRRTLLVEPTTICAATAAGAFAGSTTPPRSLVRIWNSLPATAGWRRRTRMFVKCS